MTDSRVLLEALKDLRALADRALKSITTVEGTEDRVLFHLVLLTSASKTNRTIESIVELAARGHWADTAILVRAIFDQCVQILYIAEAPEVRARLYAEYSYVARHGRLRLLQRGGFQPTAEQERQQAELTSQYERVKATYPDKRSWSGRSLKAMATEVGLGDHYDTTYWLLSNYEHSGIQATGQYSMVAPDVAALIITEETTEDLSASLLTSALTYSLLILATIDQEFVLHLEPDLSALRARIETPTTT